MRYLLFLTFLLTGCASTPRHSDMAQMSDAVSTFVALEVASGFQEANPIVAPFLTHPVGYIALAGVKMRMNHGFRQAKTTTCVGGIRLLTSTGYALGVSNTLLVLLGPVGLAAGLGVGIFNWIKNDNFIDECKLREKYPDHDIDEAWRQGLLFTAEGVRK